MDTDDRIRTALERAQQAIEMRPSIAFGTMKANVSLGDGCKCDSKTGDWSYVIDEPVSVGGEDSAPSPGGYGLGALGGCVAISIRMQAAQARVPVRASWGACDTTCRQTKLHKSSLSRPVM